MLRAGGQVRAIPGLVLGFDMTAVLAMARAAKLSEALVCEFLPAVEAEFVASANNKSDSDTPWEDSDRG